MAQFSNRPQQSSTTPRRGVVLVVEDRDDVRQGMAQLLEMHGFLVTDARNAEEAFAQLASDPGGFALILLDLQLPGRWSGRDFRMRQLTDPALAGIPTVVVTATDAGDADHDALQIDDWLVKPFRCPDLIETVKRYVVSEGSALQAESS